MVSLLDFVRVVTISFSLPFWISLVIRMEQLQVRVPLSGVNLFLGMVFQRLNDGKG